MTAPLVVACAQTGGVEEDTPPELVFQRAGDWISKAAAQGASIVVFPELFHAPFFPRQLRQDTDHLFISADGPEITGLGEICRAHKISAILPIAERAGAFRYNSAVVLDASGNLAGIYRKTHMPAYFPTELPGGTGSYEKFYFTPGEVLPTFEFADWPFGIQICNDRLYPEASRVLALAGARVIFMPISYSTYDRALQRRANWDAILRARAIENAVFVVACNRVGQEGPRHHLGLSMIIAPDGRVIATGSDNDEDLITGELHPDDIAQARVQMPWWRDRRPQLYGQLGELEPGRLA